MAMYFPPLLGVRPRQPPQNPVINRANPITRDMRHLYMPINGVTPFRDIMNKRPEWSELQPEQVQPGVFPPVEPYQGLMAAVFNGGATYQNFETVSDNFPYQSVGTTVALINTLDDTVQDGVICVNSSNENELIHRTTDFRYKMRTGEAITVTAPPLNKWVIIAGGYDNVDIFCYADGVYGTVAGVGQPASTFELTIGSGQGAFDEYEGAIAWVAFWDRVLDLAELRSFSRDWFQHVVSAFQMPVFTAAGGVTLFLRPDADDIDGDWTNEGGSNVNLFASIDETVASDADFIQSGDNPSSNKCKIRLSDPGATVDTALAHTIKYRYKRDTVAKVTDLVVRLVQGASTVIATWTHTSITTAYVDAVQTLSGAEIATITNYNDLFLEFEGNIP